MKKKKKNMDLLVKKEQLNSMYFDVFENKFKCVHDSKKKFFFNEKKILNC